MGQPKIGPMLSTKRRTVSSHHEHNRYHIHAESILIPPDASIPVFRLRSRTFDVSRRQTYPELSLRSRYRIGCIRTESERGGRRNRGASEGSSDFWPSIPTDLPFAVVLVVATSASSSFTNHPTSLLARQLGVSAIVLLGILDGRDTVDSGSAFELNPLFCMA